MPSLSLSTAELLKVYLKLRMNKSNMWFITILRTHAINFNLYSDKLHSILKIDHGISIRCLLRFVHVCILYVVSQIQAISLNLIEEKIKWASIFSLFWATIWIIALKTLAKLLCHAHCSHWVNFAFSYTFYHSTERVCMHTCVFRIDKLTAW